MGSFLMLLARFLSLPDGVSLSALSSCYRSYGTGLAFTWVRFGIHMSACKHFTTPYDFLQDGRDNVAGYTSPRFVAGHHAVLEFNAALLIG